MSVEKDYVLGTHDEEIERLGLQHRVWRPRATDAWRRAGFTTGQTLVDLGCGPGYASVDLAEIVGPAGKVVAIDRSRRFLDALGASARLRGLSQIEPLELDLNVEAPPPLAADGAWSRWVFAFVSRPRELLERSVPMLRRGGVWVLHEYVDYRTWRVSPRSEAFEAFVDEVVKAWRENGGEPDVGLDLPRWLEELGFEIRELRPLVEVARPGDFLWQWPRAFIDVGLRRLVDLGQIPQARAATMLEAWNSAETAPGAFLLTPAVLEIVAVRR